MRQIGHIENESAARTFGDFLYVRGIENQVELEPGHGWAVWIKSEENLDRARQLLADYQANPQHPSFRAQAAGAAEARAQAQKEQAEFAARVKDSKQTFAPLYGFGFGPVTLLLIIISVVVFFLSKFGKEFQPVIALFFSEYLGQMPEIRHGEVWRLFTPMFIHMNFLHLFFNMLWLRDLGSTLERRHGSLFFTGLVLTIAVASNLLQYFLAGPFFGGMSGVVYGLFGYIWLYGRLEPRSGFFIDPTSVTLMIVWFFLCMTGMMGPIANAAHGAGLGLGLLWGFLAARLNRE